MEKLKNKLKKAVFLDRDGVIVQEVHHLSRVKDLRLLRNAARAIHELNRAGFLVVVVTNQAAIARGMLDEAGYAAINAEMNRRLTKHGAHIDANYYCPHHPTGATVPEYKVVCDCRKPLPGMLHRAAKDLGIDLAKSFLVGDKHSDIGAGQAAGVKTILVQTGYGGKEGGNYVTTPDFTARNLYFAVRIILKIRRSISAQSSRT